MPKNIENIHRKLSSTAPPLLEHTLWEVYNPSERPTSDSTKVLRAQEKASSTRTAADKRNQHQASPKESIEWCRTVLVNSGLPKSVRVDIAKKLGWLSSETDPEGEALAGLSGEENTVRASPSKGSIRTKIGSEASSNAKGVPEVVVGKDGPHESSGGGNRSDSSGSLDLESLGKEISWVEIEHQKQRRIRKVRQRSRDFAKYMERFEGDLDLEIPNKVAAGASDDPVSEDGNDKAAGAADETGGGRGRPEEVEVRNDGSASKVSGGGSSSSGSHSLLREADIYMDMVRRLDELDEDDIKDMTSRVKSGLKSWLSFGMVMSGNPNLAVIESCVSSESHNAVKAIWKNDEMLKNQFNNAGWQALQKCGASPAVITAMFRGDDKLTRKSEELAGKISGEFCNWLRELPTGMDDTINSTTPEKIRSLFDTGHSLQSGVSTKTAQGIESWIKFASTMKGSKTVSISTLAVQQLAKSRFKKKFDKKGAQRSRGANQKATTTSIAAQEKKIRIQINKGRLDHRKYGVWYMEPESWQSRFHQMCSRSALRKIRKRDGSMIDVEGIVRRRAKNKVPLEMMGSTRDIGGRTFQQTDGKHSFGIGGGSHHDAEEGDEEDLMALSQLHSTRAFLQFLKDRPTYRPPAFLSKILEATEKSMETPEGNAKAKGPLHA